jgi:hypothetical protein
MNNAHGTMEFVIIILTGSSKKDLAVAQLGKSSSLFFDAVTRDKYIMFVSDLDRKCKHLHEDFSEAVVCFFFFAGSGGS